MDGSEIMSYSTDPNDFDSDDDDYSDGKEVIEGTDPLDPNDFPLTQSIEGFNIIYIIGFTAASLLLITFVKIKKKNRHLFYI